MFYENVTSAFIDLGMQLLRMPEQSSRVGTTREMLMTTITIKHPQYRCYVFPYRNDNIFAKIAETVWVLAGRNDVAFLSKYLPRAMDYSDNGAHWRAGYGARMRHYGQYDDIAMSDEFGNYHATYVDQLSEIVKLLQADRYTRRAVISLWTPMSDYEPSKDIPCLSGDTILESPEGNKTLKQLATEFSNGTITRYPVYAFDTVTKDMKLTWCTKVWKSGKKHTLKIYFDDNTVTVCTHDHKFYKKLFRNGDYCKETMAMNLMVGDRVWATKMWTSQKGYKIYKYNLNINTCHANMQSVHRNYYELINGPLPIGMIVHHANEDKNDNTSENLVGMSEGEHNSYHRTINNPMHNMPKEMRVLKGARHAIAMTGRTHSEETKHQMSLAATGRVMSEESKQKLSATKKAQWAIKKAVVNHKIVTIEYLADPIDVYDFEVGTYHNAMLNNGVFVHNCNNWLNFIIRPDKNGIDELHLNIAQRSSDIMWGFSGINTFEFATLQILLAQWLQCKVGLLNYNITSLHVYEKHFTRLAKIIDSYTYHSAYEHNLPIAGCNISSEPCDSLAKFDTCLPIFFDRETILPDFPNLDVMPLLHDNFLLRCLDMLHAYKLWCSSKPNLSGDLIDCLEAMPDDDWKLAAIEYIARDNKAVLDEVKMSDAIMTALLDCMPHLRDER